MYKEKSYLTSFEVNARIYYDANLEERATRTYPGSPASIEVNQLIFEDDDGNPIKTIEDLAAWILNSNQYSIIMEAWDDVEERTPDED